MRIVVGCSRDHAGTQPLNINIAPSFVKEFLITRRVDWDVWGIFGGVWCDEDCIWWGVPWFQFMWGGMRRIVQWTKEIQAHREDRNMSDTDEWKSRAKPSTSVEKCRKGVTHRRSWPTSIHNPTLQQRQDKYNKLFILYRYVTVGRDGILPLAHLPGSRRSLQQYPVKANVVSETHVVK